jgi:ribosomal protein L37E
MNNEKYEPATKRCLRCGNVVGITVDVCDACGFSFHAYESQRLEDVREEPILTPEGKKVCPKCGWKFLDVTANECSECGYLFLRGTRFLVDEHGLPISPLDAIDAMRDGTSKRCPVCEKMVQIDAQFCDHCQWEFTYYRCYKCMHLFHPTDKVHIQGDRLICPNCNIDLKTQDREKHVSTNVKPVVGAIGITVAFCLTYIYFTWGAEGFLPSDTQGLIAVSLIVVTALGLIYGYLKWRRSKSYIPVMGTR